MSLRDHDFSHVPSLPVAHHGKQSPVFVASGYRFDGHACDGNLLHALGRSESTRTFKRAARTKFWRVHADNPDQPSLPPNGITINNLHRRRP
jgi:hypothetical protein